MSKKLFFLIFQGGAIVFLDQLMKFIITKYFQGGFFIFCPHFIYPYAKCESISRRVFFIEAYENEGVAFGFGLPRLLILVLVTIILAILFARLKKAFKARDFFSLNCLGLILAGGFSNFIDRAVRGAVIDYIHFSFWSVFNLADVAIVVGVICLVLHELSKNRETTQQIKGF